MSKQEQERLKTLREAVMKLPRAKQDYVAGYAEALADMAKERKEAEDGNAQGREG